VLTFALRSFLVELSAHSSSFTKLLTTRYPASI